MKKFGFTLAEILIALTIIGVVAAITAPSLSKLMPNKDKVMYLKAYNSLSMAAAEILDDPAYYYPSSSGCEGFGCTGETLVGTTKYSGNTKHMCLIRDMVDVKKSNSCTEFYPAHGVKVTMSGGPTSTAITVTLEYKSKGTASKPKEYKLTMDAYGRISANDTIGQKYLDEQLSLNG